MSTKFGPWTALSTRKWDNEEYVSSALYMFAMLYIIVGYLLVISPCIMYSCDDHDNDGASGLVLSLNYKVCT